MDEYEYIVGLDLSLSQTGVAVHSIATGMQSLSVAKSAPRLEGLPGTLDRIETLLEQIQYKVPPRLSLVVVEAPSYRSQFGKPHERAGLWWAVVTDLLRKGHDVVEVAPRTRAKYIAGHLPIEEPRRGPSKREIVAASVADFPTSAEKLRNDNIADAFGLARMGARAVGSPIDATTRQRVEAVAAVRWPNNSKEREQ